MSTTKLVKKLDAVFSKYIRWYYADDIDTTSWLTTRLFRGRLEVYDRDVNVQLLRYLVLPPLQLGFRRANINLRI